MTSCKKATILAFLRDRKAVDDPTPTNILWALRTHRWAERENAAEGHAVQAAEHGHLIDAWLTIVDE